MRRMLPFLASLLLFGARPVAAQLTVQALRNLNFGPVVQGQAKSIAANDPINSGQWQFIATLGDQVRIQFTLPTRLNGPAGATMPISFGNADAIALGQGPTSVPVTFNPNTGGTFTLVSSNKIWIFLGGRVTPAANQRTGNYSNTVVLTITIL